MNTPNKSLTLLFNPFFYVAGGRALGLGLAAIFLAGLVGSWGQTHFDGVLDMHSGARAPLWLFFAEGVIDWLCLSAVLWVGGKIISPRAFRAVDLFGTQALARWPAILMSLLTLPKAFQRFGQELVAQLRQGSFHLNTADALVFFAIVFATIPLVCWMVVLMYKSFSVSVNVRGGKGIGTFIAGLLVAEVLSKVCLVLVFAHTILQTTPAAPAVSQGVSAASSAQETADLVAAGVSLVDRLAAGDFAGVVARFDGTMTAALPEPKLREAWETLRQQAGSFQKRLGTRVDEQQGYEIVFVTCQFERAVLDTKVVFDADQQVAGLFFVPSPTAAAPVKPAGN